MICMLCKRGFIVKRSLKTLLMRHDYYICDRCYKENPPDLDIITIPLDNGYSANIISILKSDSKQYHLAYINEYSLIVEKYLDKNPILYDRIYLNDKLITNLSILSALLEQDLYVIAFRVQF